MSEKLTEYVQVIAAARLQRSGAVLAVFFLFPQSYHAMTALAKHRLIAELMDPKKFPFVLSCDWFAYSCLSEWAHLTGLIPKKEVADDKKLSKFEKLFRPNVREPSAFDYLFRPVIDDEGRKKFTERRVGDVITYKGYEFRVTHAVERHINYTCAVRITWNGLDVCHLFYGEKRSLTSDRCIAKVANSLLYMDNWQRYFSDCLRACGWRVVTVNRVDLCCDFNRFCEGRDPQLFIHDYLSKPTKNRCSFIRRGSNKWRAIGERSIGSNKIETISWGTRDSPVQVNLYNKSKELMEVHSKPWIVEKWKQNGLKHGIDDAGRENSVWRVEFSINPSAMAFRKKDRSEVIDVSLDLVSSQSKLKELFAILLPRYFQFYIIPFGKCPKHVKDLDPVTLFHLEDSSDIVPMILNRCINAGRTEKLIAKRLDQLLESSIVNPEEAVHVEATRDLFMLLSLQVHGAKIVPSYDVLTYAFSYLLERKEGAPISTLSKEIRARRASRLARLVLQNEKSGSTSFDSACSLLQEEIRDTMNRFKEIFATLPDSFYEEEAEQTLSPYDMHSSKLR